MSILLLLLCQKTKFNERICFSKPISMKKKFRASRDKVGPKKIFRASREKKRKFWPFWDRAGRGGSPIRPFKRPGKIRPFLKNFEIRGGGVKTP